MSDPCEPISPELETWRKIMLEYHLLIEKNGAKIYLLTRNWEKTPFYHCHFRAHFISSPYKHLLCGKSCHQGSQKSHIFHKYKLP